jgi:hypothetical protein
MESFVELHFKNMGLRHAKAIAWESRLKAVFDAIDHELETRFGHRYPPHPARARNGETANPEDSGLFNIGAAFTPGFGSTLGKGYVVDINLSSLSRVPPGVIEEIEQYVERRLKEELPRVFPDRALRIGREGNRYKIHGDLSLGAV